MLTIEVADIELYDENTNRFTVLKGGKVELEHSLISISKWESKTLKPFIPGRSYGDVEQKTDAELRFYIQCMMIHKHPEHIVDALWYYHQREIKEYIDLPHTATIIKHYDDKKGSSKTVTNELIYAWMVSLNIPFSCEKWNINRLLVFIEVCKEIQNPSKKRRRQDVLAEQRALNQARLAETRTKGA